jgi:probable rRNA maturation factor
MLGDLALCPKVIAREARAQGKPLRNHFAHLTVHGTLHLIGYDHEKTRDAERMEAIERSVLAGLGIPDPYA